MKSNFENILSKIRKLLKLAEGTDNKEESASAAAMAAQIMERHNIMEADLPTGDERVKPVMEEVGGLNKQMVGWKGRLGCILADAFGCAARWRSVERYGIRYIRISMAGRPDDVKVCGLAWDFCEKEIDRLSAKACKGCGRTFGNNYRLGCVDAIKQSIREEKAALHEELRDQVSSSALVVVENRIVEAKKAFNIKYSSRSGGHRHDRGAREQGRHDGQNIWTGTKKRVSA
ncbi:hypothetical protein LCGC14_0674390 [marine sediment metagenome]|uniref:Uncharacterized protein n=1 Tax=marine sediment metagenome TaxID=412755 RepID=A0A0F9RAI2_9ZZZZ